VARVLGQDPLPRGTVRDFVREIGYSWPTPPEFLKVCPALLNVKGRDSSTLKPMNNRYWLFKRGGVYYIEDTATGKQQSLRTRDRATAEKLRNAKSDAAGQSRDVNLLIGRAFISSADPLMPNRTWKEVMDQFSKHGKEQTQKRAKREVESKPFDRIRNKPLMETTADDFSQVILSGTVSTAHYLRRLQNLALGMGWIVVPVLPARMWPKPIPKRRRGITLEEHERILAAEKHPERRLYYRLLWEIGAAQTDAANLTAENIDWTRKVLTYTRRKTGQVAALAIGPALENLLRQLPTTGKLYPYISTLRDTDRSSAFRIRCMTVGISGVTLHSYRYAWAERAKLCGIPVRFAQAALGQDSKAVHEAYARNAIPVCPSLDGYENNIIPLPITSVPPARDGTA
jgi:hypothetical protein